MQEPDTTSEKRGVGQRENGSLMNVFVVVDEENLPFAVLWRELDVIIFKERQIIVAMHITHGPAFLDSLPNTQTTRNVSAQRPCFA